MMKYLKAEAIKLTTIRSTWVCVALVVVFAVGIGYLASGSIHSDGGESLTLRSAVFQNQMLGLAFSQLVVMVMGALVICSEYRFGIIRATFAAAPRRWRLVIAKFAAVAILAAVVGLVTTFLTYFITYSRISSKLSGTGVGIGLGDPGVVRALIGNVVFFVAAALFAVAIGALVRNQIAAISIVLLYPTIVESIIRALLRTSSSTEGLAKFLPYNAGSAVGLLDQSGTELNPIAGLLLFVAVTLVLLVIAGTSINRRDA